MKRLHIHIGVDQLEAAITFYSKLLGAEPTKRKPDYAKWMVEDPRINLAISTKASKNGVDHLGIQVDEKHELQDIRTQLQEGNVPVGEEGETLCCYAKSDKSWVMDPAGIPWEAYRTMEDADIFSPQTDAGDGACCAPGQLNQPQAGQAREESTTCCG